MAIRMTARTSREIDTLILLTGRDEAPLLADILRAYNAALAVVPVHDKAAVTTACLTAGPGTRLLSVCSPVIVPDEALRALPGPAYNFHPGPPTRPGRYPGVFALYHEDARFGVTVHEMAARVDSGPIVAVDLFDVPHGCDLRTLENLTFKRLIALLRTLGPHLARIASPLPAIDAAWSGRKTRLAEVDVLARLTPDLTPAEIARRRRALGGQVFEPDPGWMRTDH